MITVAIKSAAAFAKHRLWQAARMKRLYWERKIAGQCVRCGEPLPADHESLVGPCCAAVAKAAKDRFERKRYPTPRPRPRVAKRAAS